MDVDVDVSSDRSGGNGVRSVLGDQPGGELVLHMVNGGSGEMREELQYEEDKNTNRILAPSKKSTEKILGREGGKEEGGTCHPLLQSLQLPSDHTNTPLRDRRVLDVPQSGADPVSNSEVVSEGRDDARVHGGAQPSCDSPAKVARGGTGGLSRSGEDVPAQPSLAVTDTVDPFAVDSSAVVPGGRQLETGLAGELPTPLVLGLGEKDTDVSKENSGETANRNNSRPTR